MIKQGESLFIPFQNGEGIRDAHGKVRTYKNIDACRNALKRAFDKVEIVEYVPVMRGEWKHFSTTASIVPATDWLQCTACGKMMHRLQGVRYDFCPRCGALIDGKENEKDA